MPSDRRLRDSQPDDVHHLELDSRDVFHRRVVSEIDALATQIHVSCFTFVMESDVVSLDHQRIHEPFAVLTLDMRGHFRAVGLYEFFMTFQEFFRVGLHVFHLPGFIYVARLVGLSGDGYRAVISAPKLMTYRCFYALNQCAVGKFCFSLKMKLKVR